MRIALFTETYLPDVNGVSAHVDTLKIGLEELGHEVLVVTADKKVRRHHLENGILRCPSIESKKLYGFGIAAPYSYRRMKYIQNFNPDVIHIHHEFGIGLSGVLAAYLLKIPVVYTLHTMYDMYVHYIAPEPFAKLATTFSHKYEKFIAARSTLLASPSRKGEAYFKKIGVPDKEFHLIPNSADFERFYPHVLDTKGKYNLRGQLHIHPEDTIACFVGRLGEEKSVDVLLDYWAKAITEEDKLHLMIIGDGPDKEALIEQTKALGIEHMVTFTGRIEHSEVPKYFALSDLFVTASLSEMNSISMLEGMASGLPTLQQYDELNADQIQVGVNGYHYNTGEEMGGYLKMIAALPFEEKEDLKEQVRNSVSGRDTKGLAEYILKVYDRAIITKALERAHIDA